MTARTIAKIIAGLIVRIIAGIVTGITVLGKNQIGDGKV